MRYRADEDYQAFDAHVSLAAKSSQAFLYAVVLTNSRITCSDLPGAETVYAAGVKPRGFATVRVFVHKEEIERFQKVAGIKLTNPPVARTNGGA